MSRQPKCLLRTNGHLEILAELFSAEAELCLAQNNRAGAVEYSRKALRLFEFIDAEYKTYSQERIGKMDALRKKLLNPDQPDSSYSE